MSTIRKRPSTASEDQPLKRTKIRGNTQLKPAQGGSWSEPNPMTQPSAFIFALSQYPILTSLCSHLRPKDLIPLSQTCQTIHSYLNLSNPKFRANLLTKTLCSGKGIAIRKNSHSYEGAETFVQLWKCGGEVAGNEVESKPCVSCGVNTCDECRIHATYMNMVEDPGLEGRRWWAGHSFLFGSPVVFFPPKTVSNGKDGTGKLSNNSAWNLTIDKMCALHDQGRMHLPFRLSRIADPESIARLLDTKLGISPIEPAGRMELMYDGTGIAYPFNEMARGRMEMMCRECHSKTVSEGKVCECTLRQRFLDRWLCLPCCLKEQNVDWRRADRPIFAEGMHQTSGGLICICGKIEGFGHIKYVCAWCDGEIIDHPEEEEEEEEDEVSQVEAEQGVEELTPVEGKDIDENGHPASGWFYNANGWPRMRNWVSHECLSRGAVQQWLDQKEEVKQVESFSSD